MNQIAADYRKNPFDHIPSKIADDIIRYAQDYGMYNSAFRDRFSALFSKLQHFRAPEGTVVGNHRLRDMESLLSLDLACAEDVGNFPSLADNLPRQLKHLRVRVRAVRQFSAAPCVEHELRSIDILLNRFYNRDNFAQMDQFLVSLFLLFPSLGVVGVSGESSSQFDYFTREAIIRE